MMNFYGKGKFDSDVSIHNYFNCSFYTSYLCIMKYFFQPGLVFELFFVKTWKYKNTIIIAVKFYIGGKKDSIKEKNELQLDKGLPVKMCQLIINQNLSVYSKNSSC